MGWVSYGEPSIQRGFADFLMMEERMCGIYLTLNGIAYFMESNLVVFINRVGLAPSLRDFLEVGEFHVGGRPQ